jgi:uncharacterized membrane protein YdjX (TVP38/TMEM64 family)
MRRALPVIGVLFLLTAICAGHWLRAGLDMEMSATAIQARVAEFGWKAPAIYVVLVIFRQFLAIPAMVLLTAAGLCFGALTGGVLGSIGILLSGVMKFSIARVVGRDVLRRWGGDYPRRIERRVGRLGPAAIALGTAYPISPMALLHWAAGLTPISLGAFIVALTLGAPVRAFAYAFFGQALVDVGSGMFWIATVSLLGAIAIPFLIPSVRAHLRDAYTGRSEHTALTHPSADVH